MTEPIKIKKFTELPSSLSDCYGGMRGRMLFSIADSDNTMIGGLIDCKGYINNRVYGALTGTVQGNAHKWQKGFGTLDRESFRVLVAYPEAGPSGFNTHLLKAVDLLNQLEKDLGLIKSKLFLTTGAPEKYGPVYILVGSKRWLLSPVMVNLYIWLVRDAAPVHVISKDYMTAVKAATLGEYNAKGVEFIVKNKYWKVFGKDLDKNWKVATERSTAEEAMHEMGISMFSGGTYPFMLSQFPHWMVVGRPVTTKTLKEKAA